MAPKPSRIPGDFETDEDGVSNTEDHGPQIQAESSDDLSFLLRAPSESNSLLPLDEDSGAAVNSNTILEERKINDMLMDVESSFLPEFSHLSVKDGLARGADDTLLFGIPSDKSEPEAGLRSPKTPPDSYKTPAPEQQHLRQLEESADKTPDMPNTSSLETMSSSPTAAAAARTVSRVQSMATMGGYETADDREFAESPTGSLQYGEDTDATPRKGGRHTSVNSSPTRSRAGLDGNSESADEASDRWSKRPKYLNSRSSQQRLSYSSINSSNTDASDATLGADFALQSGGALPEPRLQRKPNMMLSRSTSLSSIISAISGMSDDEGRTRKSMGLPDLSTLDEEHSLSSPAGKRSPGDGPVTPRASFNHLIMPTDTVIANNVRDIEVPSTFARQYRQQQQQVDRNLSPDKTVPMAGMTPGPKRGMTLKEHRSTVERLGKENFDLKMKIHFLDQALQKRSEDGVKEMITENVQLKSDRMRLEKDNHSLRKQVRELQKKLDASGARDSPGADQGYGTDEERSPTAEEEVIYLRERVEVNEIEIEKLRMESIARESEKRRLAEMVRSLGDTRGGVSDVGSREERDMWKDMLEAETIAREQSEEECKRLRDEIAKVRNESFGQGRSISRKQQRLGGGSIVSRSSSREAPNDLRADAAELERLRHEVSELQKMIGAQASTLTSRNKEKERLYQEIEDLKLGRMGGHGVRSVAGDSIFERSASRARSNSRASNGTRFSAKLTENERESMETKINELRDQVSELKLENQNLKTQSDEILAELDAVDAQAQADADQFNEELRLLTQERDDALRDAEEQDAAFQSLKNEAQEEIDGLGDELDAKVDECARLECDLRTEAENVKALQAEMRRASEGLIRLEEDAQQNLARYTAVQGELDDANRELERMEQSLQEAEAKIQRLGVQQESGLNEIAFLREEQDADKIKIGDLESLLKKVHLNLDSERDRARELDRRLTEERQQREAVASQEKQEVQRMINDLNREVSGAKEEVRRVKKALSSREIEASAWRDRHGELEGSLREVLGVVDTNVSRSSLISTVTRMQRELDQTSVDLDATRRRLDEKETLLASRDALLESTGLEYRKIADLLERERQARRQDKHSFEQSLKSHQQSAKALSANNSRIAELEQARQSDRKKLAQLEQQYREQLAERNAVLLSLWKKLSAMCGPDWAHNNSLINGNLPSQEVIGNILFWPGFSRNLLLATKQVEGTLSTFKEKIKRVERELWKEYQGLEHTLELRTKKLERLEEVWERMKASQAEAEQQQHHGRERGTRPSSSKTPEMQKLKSENRLLKAELSLFQQQHANAHFRAHERGQSRASSAFSGGTSNDGTASLVGTTTAGIPQRGSSMRGYARHPTTSSGGPGTITRGHTTNIMEHLIDGDRSIRSNSISSRTSHLRGAVTGFGDLILPAGPLNAPSNGNFPAPPTGPPSNHSGSDVASVMSSGQGQEKWIHRLRELERRLKAEREARLLDRSGARRRLEERDAVNEELRLALERERMRKEVGVSRAEA
jgi:Centrosomin N-terminal motif 1/Micro-tubular organiser Mto1 C-term Mto2-binding region